MIPLLPVDEAIRRGKEAGLDDRFSSLNAFRVMLHSSRAAGAVAELLRTLMFHNTVNARARELVILRNGWRTRSEYEFCQHVRVSRDLKMTDEEILGVRLHIPQFLAVILRHPSTCCGERSEIGIDGILPCSDLTEDLGRHLQRMSCIWDTLAVA